MKSPMLLVRQTVGSWIKTPYASQRNEDTIMELYGSSGSVPTDLSRSMERIVGNGWVQECESIGIN